MIRKLGLLPLLLSSPVLGQTQSSELDDEIIVQGLYNQ